MNQTAPLPVASLQGLKFLVTGGAGFIGSHLAEHLLAAGAFVRVLDNLFSGSLTNIKLLQRFDHFEFIKGDIRCLDDCRKACSGMDYVLHQAAVPSVARSIEDPLTTHQVNCDGFLNLLLAAGEQKISRMVYASSSSVYGDDQALPKREDKLGKPLSPYAVSKRTNELYATVFSRTMGMQLIGLRYFNVFGPRQDPQSPYAAVIPRFIHALRQRKPPIIFGDGLQSRDFTFIDNVIHANLQAVFTNQRDAIGNVFNIACGRSYTLLELFAMICTILRQKGNDIPDHLQPNFEPPRPGDILHSQADISQARILLNYQPAVNLEEGLRRMIDQLA